LTTIDDLKKVRDTFNQGIDPIIQTVGIPLESYLRFIKTSLNSDVNAVIADLEHIISPIAPNQSQEKPS